MELNRLFLKQNLEGKKAEAKATFKYAPELALEYLKWLSYILQKEQDKIKKLLDKNTDELSLNDLEVLKKYKKNQEIIKLFNRYCSDECKNKDILPVYDYLHKYPIEKIMKTKLTKTEINEANELIKKYYNLSYHDMCNLIERMIDDYDKLSIKEAYIFHEIKKIATIKEKENLANNIKSRLETNDMMRPKRLGLG